MFDNIMKIFRKIVKKEEQTSNSKSTAKERLHLVLMQDRANVSADFLDLMKQEIIEVIKKYIEIDETAIDVRLTNKENEDGTNGAPALYANIPILNIKDEVRKNSKVQETEKNKNDIEEKNVEVVEEKNDEVKEDREDANNIEEIDNDKESSKNEESKNQEEIKASEEAKKDEEDINEDKSGNQVENN